MTSGYFLCISFPPARGGLTKVLSDGQRSRLLHFPLLVIILLNGRETHPAGQDSRRSAGAASPLKWAAWRRPRTVHRLWRRTGHSGSTCTGEGSRRHHSGSHRGKGSSHGLWKKKQYLLGDGLGPMWPPHGCISECKGAKVGRQVAPGVAPVPLSREIVDLQPSLILYTCFCS